MRQKSTMLLWVMLLNMIALMLVAQSWVTINFIDTSVALPPRFASAADLSPILPTLFIINFIIILIIFFSKNLSIYIYVTTMLISCIASLFIILRIVNNAHEYVLNNLNVDLILNVAISVNLDIWIAIIAISCIAIICCSLLYLLTIIRNWDSNKSSKTSKIESVEIWDSLEQGNDPT